DATARERAVDAWFCEQFEIQPVFYQAVQDLPSFRVSVDRFLRREHDTVVRKCDYLYAKLADWSRRIGASLDRDFQVRYEVSQLWLRYREMVGLQNVEDA
ncbi:MAG: hypothetical protein ACPHRO_02470, partial [Nannocystaceae bacterium]